MAGDFTFLKGNVETIILCSLYSGDKYGYEIAKEIQQRTENKYQIKQPTLYNYLKRLESEGLILSYWGTESNGGRRRYYKLTEEGQKNCTAFMAEWKYQKNVLENLVDNTDVELTQEEVTSMFGSKQKRQRRQKTVDETSISEQEEIAERLRRLESAPDAVAAAAQKDEAVEEKPTEPQNATDKSKFIVQQADAEDFMKDFDQRAEEISQMQADNENYHSALNDILGDQLEDMQHYTENNADTSASMRYANDRPLPLEDVADELAKNGVRLRIYSRTTAVYRPKTLLPMTKIYFLTSALTYAAVFALLALLCIVTIGTGTWTAYVITAALLLLAPVVCAVRMFMQPGRQNKPEYDFRRLMLIAAIVWFAVTSLFLVINVFANIKFSEFGQVAARILLPSVIASAFPLAVLFFHRTVTNYSK